MKEELFDSFFKEGAEFGLVKLWQSMLRKQTHKDLVGVGDIKFVSLEPTLIVIILKIKIAIQQW